MSADQAFDWLSGANNNLEHSAILAGSDPGGLSPATDIEIFVERDGVRVRAKSPGRSLIVIPFYFSHCLRAIDHDNRQQPELRRADLALTGVLFNGDLNVTIKYWQGPFQQARCRLDDLAEDRRLIQAP
jgi:hypothetical protein